MCAASTKNREHELGAEQQRLIRAARRKCFILYEGHHTPHRSCGIALAETFNLPTAPYQSLRKGGISGCGECGSIVAGRLILGQVFGDPDPTGAVTDTLRAAMTAYEALWPDRIDRGRAPADTIVCNALTGQFDDFASPERARFCTHLASEVAAACAEVILRCGGSFEVTPIEGYPEFDPAAV